MTLREAYEAMQSDYEDVISRLLTDERVKKYLLKFLDNDECQQTIECIEQKKYEEAFRHAHNLKGMSLNLGITVLFTASNELCEALRDGEPSVDISSLTENTKNADTLVKDIIKQL